MENKVYEKHELDDESLYPTQRIRLELAAFIDKLCRKHDIKYTLFFSSLAGAVHEGGFFKDVYYLEMAMIYKDLLRFKQVFINECKDTDYYYLDHTNFEQFDQLDLLIMKRGSVSLPSERKKEECYFDLGVVISPIFYAGNTLEEKKAFEQQTMELVECLTAKDYVPQVIPLRNRILHANYWRKRKRLLKKRSNYSFEDLKAHLTKYAETPTKYVNFPPYEECDGITCEADTYEDLIDIRFEDCSFCAIRKGQQWVDEWYEKDGIEYFREMKFRLFYAYGIELLREVQLIQLDLLKEIDRICRENDIVYYLNFGALLGAIRHGGFIPWDDDADVVMMWEDYCKFCNVVDEELDHERFFFRTPYTDPDCNFSWAHLKRNNTIQAFKSRLKTGTHLGICVDIFPMYNGSNSFILHRVQDKICRFFKTMIWSHLGAAEEKRLIPRLYYRCLAKTSNIKAYDLFLKAATFFKKETGKLAYPYYLGRPCPFNCGHTNKNYYGEPVEVEFEGHQFLAPRHYRKLLEETYSKDYMKYPPYNARLAIHGVSEILDLRGLQNEE